MWLQNEVKPRLLNKQQLHAFHSAAQFQTTITTIDCNVSLVHGQRFDAIQYIMNFRSKSMFFFDNNFQQTIESTKNKMYFTFQNDEKMLNDTNKQHWWHEKLCQFVSVQKRWPHSTVFIQIVWSVCLCDFAYILCCWIFCIFKQIKSIKAPLHPKINRHSIKLDDALWWKQTNNNIINTDTNSPCLQWKHLISKSKHVECKWKNIESMLRKQVEKCIYFCLYLQQATVWTQIYKSIKRTKHHFSVRFCFVSLPTGKMRFFFSCSNVSKQT